MIKTKEVRFNYAGFDHLASVEYEDDGTILTVVIDGDIMDLIKYQVFDDILDEFNRVDEDE